MNILKVLLQRTMLVNLLLGFSSGLPLLLTFKTLQGLLTDAQVPVSLIGFFSVLSLAYTLKFLWAPVFDRFTLPFLGRRRGWLLVLQVALAASIYLLAITPPNGGEPLSTRLPQFLVEFLAWCSPKMPESQISFALMLACLLVAFLSATQDIVIDAYRRESLRDEELGFGSTLYITGYRIAMLVSGGLAFILADKIGWQSVYTLMAALMGVGIFATLYGKEPKMEYAPPRTFKETVVDPLGEFFTRKGVLTALGILAFILLYKVGDTMAGAMATPLYKSLGFTNEEIGYVAKFFGLAIAIGGGFIGAAMILKIGIARALLLCGLLQAASTLGYAVLAASGKNFVVLASVIAFEDLTSAMGTAAFAAYMAMQTNKRFTAYQYALLTSIMGIPRVVFTIPTGVMVEKMGYQSFFVFCTVIAVPGILLLIYMMARDRVRTV
jgi:MFS transporter, PAT family, beta-lactamase induction signal transducer AmpG